MKKDSVLYRLVHVFLLLLIALCGFGKICGINHFGIKHWLLAMVCLGVMMGVNFGNWRSRILVAVLILVTAIALLMFVGVEQVGAFWANYGSWLLGTSEWEIEWIIGYELFQVIILVVLCYFLQILLEKYSVLMTVLSLGLLGSMIIGMSRGVEIEHIAVVGAVGYLLLNYLESTQRGWNKSVQGSLQAYILWLMPFILLYVVLLWLAPVYEEPYDWAFVKEAYNNLKERYTIWSQSVMKEGQEDFETALAGFSEEGRLVGSLLENDKELMIIQGTQGLVTNVYLVGKVYDSFNGMQWSQTVYEEVPYGMDTLETLYALESYEQEHVRDYVYSTGLSVRYEYFHTGYLFSPLKATEIEECEYHTEGGNLVFDEKRGYGSSYKLTFYQLNLDHEKFYSMVDSISPHKNKAEQLLLEQGKLKNSWTDNEQLWNQVVDKYDISEHAYTLEELQEYRQHNQQWYGSELTLSKDVEMFLQEITEETDTTVSKLRAIEKMLSEMEYTKNPGVLPNSVQSSEDFLDYFLLESKQGYCSHFATAFVLLARAEGIPARYVEGFCVPLNGNKNMTVTGNMAHAWPEVYLEGVGWIPFEPTPGYAEIRYTPWKVEEELHNTEYSYEEDWEEEEVIADVLANEEKIQETEEMQNASQALVWKIVGLMLLAGAALLYIEMLWFRHRYKKMSLEQQYLFELKKNLWLLARLGLRRTPEETLQEFSKRVTEKLQQNLIMGSSLQWIQGFEEYLYGEQKITKEMKDMVICESEQLLFELKNQKKTYYYYILARMVFVR